MNKRSFYTLITIGLIISMINGCEKDNKEIDNLGLLTNNSSKIWYLKNIVTNDLITIEQPTCVSDDERKFLVNGKCIIDNMGTILKTSDILHGIPPHCKDTINIIDTIYWNFNPIMDTLTIYYAKFVLIGKILKLTTDSLILNYAVNDSFFQTNFYVAKKIK